VTEGVGCGLLATPQAHFPCSDPPKPQLGAHGHGTPALQASVPEVRGQAP
jgi:hypothetical protein